VGVYVLEGQLQGNSVGVEEGAGLGTEERLNGGRNMQTGGRSRESI
jgi:hypothetical protein